jgi:uncharacterized membrane protein (DUF485 family)
MKGIPEEDLEDQQTLLDPRDRYNDEVEEYLAAKKKSLSCWGHLFMLVLLITIIMVYFKLNMLATTDAYPFLVALAVPFAILTLLFAAIIYEGYLWKLSDSHRNVYLWLMTLLVVTSICFITAMALFCLYL